jgi:hypothetical protein
MYQEFYHDEYEDHLAERAMWDWLDKWWWTLIPIVPLIPFLVIGIGVYALIFGS